MTVSFRVEVPAVNPTSWKPSNQFGLISDDLCMWIVWAPNSLIVFTSWIVLLLLAPPTTITRSQISDKFFADSCLFFVGAHTVSINLTSDFLLLDRIRLTINSTRSILWVVWETIPIFFSLGIFEISVSLSTTRASGKSPINPLTSTCSFSPITTGTVSYTHLRAHET